MPTDKQTVDWYDQNAAQYAKYLHEDEGKYHFGLEKPAMYAELPDLGGKSVLSLGCGPGADSAYLQSIGATRSVGIDVSEKLVDIARDEHPECEFHIMDMEQLDFDDNAFDLVYSSLAMHYLPDWQSVLSESYRVLKPGGVLLFSVGHPVSGAMHQTSDVERKELYIGAKINKQTHDVDIYGEYLQPITLRTGGDMDVVIYHRPLSMMVNEIIGSGFMLEKMIEPSPIEDMKKASLRHYKLHQTIPFVVIFKLLKPDLE